MTKLPNIEDVVAIDIHTHAEEPCGMHGDDGYDDFQAQMAILLSPAGLLDFTVWRIDYTI